MIKSQAFLCLFKHPCWFRFLIFALIFLTELWGHILSVQITVKYFHISDDMVDNENETLRDRVSDLEKKVHDQNDEITCLRATLADALRRINQLESGKGWNDFLTNIISIDNPLTIRFGFSSCTSKPRPCARCSSSISWYVRQPTSSR